VDHSNVNLNSIVAAILGDVRRDETWQDIGFPKRPKYGAFVQRFRAQWRVQLEKAILKQMIAVLTAAYVAAGALRRENLPEVLRLFVDGAGSTYELWRSYGYTSRSEAIQHLGSAVNEYIASDPNEWADILIPQLDLSNVSDKKLNANLFLGVVRFSLHARDLVGILMLESQREKTDPLLNNAVTLVQAAHISAVGMFTSLLDRFPILRQVDAEHWDFMLTVAGVFMAATGLTKELLLNK